jgi:hypothetical protein
LFIWPLASAVFVVAGLSSAATDGAAVDAMGCCGTRRGVLVSPVRLPNIYFT